MSSQSEPQVVTGAKVVEATHKIYGKYSKWALFIGLGLAAYIYSLDGQTTYSYLAFAASDLEDHSLISSIQTAQSIISLSQSLPSSALPNILYAVAVGKPLIARLADVSSRGTAYILVCAFPFHDCQPHAYLRQWYSMSLDISSSRPPKKYRLLLVASFYMLCKLNFLFD